MALKPLSGFEMGGKRRGPEEIVAKLLQVDALTMQGLGCGSDPIDRRDGGYLLPVTPELWWVEVRPGQPTEGFGGGGGPAFFTAGQGWADRRESRNLLTPLDQTGALR